MIMKKSFLCLLVLFSFCICTVSYARNEEPIQSTQGIEIDQNIEKSKDHKTLKMNKNKRKIVLKYI